MSAQTEIQTLVLAVGDNKTLQIAGAAFEVLSVSPPGFAIRIRPDNGEWDIYAAGQGDTPKNTFTKLDLVHDVFPPAFSNPVTVRILVTRTSKINRIVRTRDMEVISYGFGIINIAAGGRFTFDIFAVSPALIQLLPTDWRLSHARTTFTLFDPGGVQPAAVFILANSSVGAPLIQNVPFVYRSMEMPIVLNNTAGAVNLTALQEFYILP